MAAMASFSSSPSAMIDIVSPPFAFKPKILSRLFSLTVLSPFFMLIADLKFLVSFTSAVAGLACIPSAEVMMEAFESIGLLAVNIE